MSRYGDAAPEERPLVTIVTPSYNQRRYVEETLCSVFDQDYPRIEYIVVDGGSTDGTQEILRRYASRLAWFVSEPDLGQAAAINRGFAAARGDLLAWLSSDDTLVPGAVSRAVECFERDPNTVLVYGDAYFVDAESNRIGYLESRPYDRVEMMRMCRCDVVQPGSFFRKRAWQIVGPIDETRHWYFDYELFLSLGDHGNVVRIPEPLATYRLHPASKTIGRPKARAAEYERVADEFFTAERFVGVVAGLQWEARASAYYLAADSYYQAYAMGDARRCLLRAFGLGPRSRLRVVSLFLRTLVPRWAIAELRGRRRRDPLAAVTLEAES